MLMCGVSKVRCPFEKSLDEDRSIQGLIPGPAGFGNSHVVYGPPVTILGDRGALKPKHLSI